MFRSRFSTKSEGDVMRFSVIYFCTCTTVVPVGAETFFSTSIAVSALKETITVFFTYLWAPLPATYGLCSALVFPLDDVDLIACLETTFFVSLPLLYFFLSAPAGELWSLCRKKWKLPIWTSPKPEARL